jgi:ribonuclease HII
MNLKNFDISLLEEGIQTIAGVDEAGRGPLAGPVVAAAVIFNNGVFIDEVDDSKKLCEKKREKLYDQIINNALTYGVGIVECYEIDKMNILQATLRAMKNAVGQLSIKPDLIIIDGNKSFYSKIPTKTIIRGDSKSFSIAAASIIAKVTRDHIMIKAAKTFPGYRWETNKGYATKAHIQAIQNLGYTTFHRKTFLRKIITNQINHIEL